jgi:hypothetical protein
MPYALQLMRFKPDHWSPPLPITGHSLSLAAVTCCQLLLSALFIEGVAVRMVTEVSLVFPTAMGLVWLAGCLLDAAREPLSQLFQCHYAAQPEQTWQAYLSPAQYCVMRLGWHDKQTLQAATSTLPALVLPTLKDHATQWFVCRACSSLLVHTDRFQRADVLSAFFGTIKQCLEGDYMVLLQTHPLLHDPVRVACQGCGSLIGHVTMERALCIYRAALVGGNERVTKLA